VIGPADQPPTLVAEPPQGEGWTHEIKCDGYRTGLVVNDGNAEDGKAVSVGDPQTEGLSDAAIRLSKFSEPRSYLPLPIQRPVPAQGTGCCSSI
jgi:hypothetical protein